VENYFNYFTEIEDRYLQRRGGGLLLSTLDWALIETWKDAGIPLEAVLRGIDAAFDQYDQRPRKTKKINSLAYCSQEVMGAAEDMKEAAVGATTETTTKAGAPQGFEPDVVAAYLLKNADSLDAARKKTEAAMVQSFLSETANSLRKIAGNLKSEPTRLEDLERRLTVLEEKLFAVLLTSSSDDEIVAVRAQADRDLIPYRSKMSGAQIDQLHKQYVHKRLMEKFNLPRLSLFYM
jgi:hypothetical protein